MAEDSQNRERFTTETPSIPGVSERPETKIDGVGHGRSNSFKGIGLLLVAAVALGAGMVWWMHRAPLSRATASGTTTGTQPLSSPDAAFAAAAGRTTSSDGEVAIATIQELEKPWSAKEFIFRKPITREKVRAIVVRLPNGPPDRETCYWAFALEEPFEHCALEYVADLDKLASQYGLPRVPLHGRQSLQQHRLRPAAPRHDPKRRLGAW